MRFRFFKLFKMSNMFDKVVAVISKKPDLRQEFEIQGLMPWFRKKSQLFSQLKTGKDLSYF